MRLAHHGPPADYRQPTMDDIPVPCGSWKENYENNQRKYNVQLVFGSGFFVLTLIVVRFKIDVIVLILILSKVLSFYHIVLFSGYLFRSF